MDIFTTEQRALYDSLLPEFNETVRKLKENGFEPSAYKKAKRRYHPDRNKGNEAVYTVLFQQLGNASAPAEGKRSEWDAEDGDDFNDEDWAAGGSEAEEADSEEDEKEFKSRADFAKAHPDAEAWYEEQLRGFSASKNTRSRKQKSPEPEEEVEEPAPEDQPAEEPPAEPEEKGGKEEEPPRKQKKKKKKRGGEEAENEHAQASGHPPVSDFETEHIAFNADGKERTTYAYVVVRFEDGSPDMLAKQKDLSPAVRMIFDGLRALRNVERVKEAMAVLSPSTHMNVRCFAQIWLRMKKTTRSQAADTLATAFTELHPAMPVDWTVYLSTKPMFCQQHLELHYCLTGHESINPLHFFLRTHASQVKADKAKQQREKREAKEHKDALRDAERAENKRARDAQREEKEMKRSNSLQARQIIQTAILKGDKPHEIWRLDPKLMIGNNTARETAEWYRLNAQARKSELPSALPFTMYLTDKEGYDVKCFIKGGSVDPIACRDEAKLATDKKRHWAIFGPPNTGKSFNLARWTRGTRTCMFGADPRYPFEQYTGSEDLLICDDSVHGVEFQDVIQACNVQFADVAVKVRFDSSRCWQKDAHRTVVIIGNARALMKLDWLDKAEYKARFNELNLYDPEESLFVLRQRYISKPDDPIWDEPAAPRKRRERGDPEPEPEMDAMSDVEESPSRKRAAERDELDEKHTDKRQRN